MLIEKLKDYHLQKKALFAFNIQNIYQLEALNNVANKLKKPVIAQFSSKFISHFDALYGFDSLLKKYQSDLLFFHLDHCKNENIISYCIEKGFDSVMFDGSSYSIEQNIYLSNKYFEIASNKNCLLEVELGEISGVEDDFGVESGSRYDQNELENFVKNARFNLLALSIGNAHGVYKTIEKVNIELLKEAQEAFYPLYLVLHGATGMSDEMIRKSIEYGVVKVNISTELKIVTFNSIKKYTATAKIFDEIDFSQYLSNELQNFFLNVISKF